MGDQRETNADAVAGEIKQIHPVETVTEGQLRGLDGEGENDGERSRGFAPDQTSHRQGGGEEQEEVKQGPRVCRIVLQAQGEIPLVRNFTDRFQGRGIGG